MIRDKVLTFIKKNRATFPTPLDEKCPYEYGPHLRGGDPADLDNFIRQNFMQWPSPLDLWMKLFEETPDFWVKRDETLT